MEKLLKVLTDPVSNKILKMIRKKAGGDIGNSVGKSKRSARHALP